VLHQWGWYHHNLGFISKSRELVIHGLIQDMLFRKYSMWRSLKCSLKPSLGNHRGFPHKVNYFFKSSKLRNMTNKTQLVYPNTSQNKTPTDTVCCSFACRVPAWSPVKPCVFMYFFATLSQKVGLDPNTPQKVNTTHHHSPSFIKKNTSHPFIHESPDGFERTNL
jgi:hypothetical protein